MRVPTHLPDQAHQIAADIAAGRRDQARAGLAEASPKLVLDVVYAFCQHVTVPIGNGQSVPANPNDPETLAVSVHVVRNLAWIL